MLDWQGLGIIFMIYFVLGKLTPRPVELSASNITHTSAKISWNFTENDGEDMDSFWVRYQMIFREDDSEGDTSFMEENESDESAFLDLTHVEGIEVWLAEISSNLIF